jgi:hypothetical protein
MNPDSAPVPTLPTSPATIGRWRIAIGLVQGLCAWWLLRLVAPSNSVIARALPVQTSFWSERHPILFAALGLVTAFVPAIAVAELGRMRRKTLTLYLVTAGAVVATLAAYDLWRSPQEILWNDEHVRVWPSFQVTFCIALGLFVVNQLLEHRERGRALFDAYAVHFEDSWMRGFQLVISLIFALLFWGILELGAALFGLIHLEWFRTMIEHNWFRCPALAMAFAGAIHLTDVRPTLLKGMRNVGLTLLSWLLPLVVTLSVAFLAALTWVGVKPLFDTRHAASILLWASAITLLLLNAAYKDGDPSTLPPRILRWAGRVAGPSLLALALIAAYAISLRIRQYGWTPDRVLSTAVATVSCVYGLGYSAAALARTAWLKPLETVNVFASLVILGVLLLLLTPAADPARLSVDSQLARLAHGQVSAGDFDYQFLRFDSGVFGRHALLRLEHDADPEVRSRAARMQDITVRRYYAQGKVDPAATEAAFSHATIYPIGTPLPADFKSQDWGKNASFGSDCLQNGGICEIYVVPYGSAGAVAVIVHAVPYAARPANFYPSSSARLYERDVSGHWVNTGIFNHIDCPDVVTALRAGKVTPVRPEHDDLLVNGLRLKFISTEISDSHCAGQTPPNKSPEPAPTHDAHAPAHLGPAFGTPGGS